MMNRLIKCISLAKNPLNIQPTYTILRGICKIPTNFHVGIVSYDFSSSKKGFCSSSVGKLRNIKDDDHLSESSQSSSIFTENKNNNETEETIPKELETAMEADPTLLKRYKILQLEVDVMRHGGKLIPGEIKPSQWIELLKEPTRSARRKYLQFLFINEKKRENQKKKLKEAEAMRKIEQQTMPIEEDGNEYGLHRIALFMRIYDTTMNHFYNSRLIQAMQFGEKLVIDCGYHAQMTPRESGECAKQLAYMFAQNRLHRDPFDLHFCNVDKSSLLMQKLHRILPTIYDPTFPLNISEKSYLESFEKNKLVYLTPHCKTEMQNYEPDSVYIVGAIVDKTQSNPLSLAKAKKEELRMAKLPLNRYLPWGTGSSKRLPLNQMVNILTDIRITRDWNIALRHIPRRKVDRSFNDFNNFNDGTFEHHKRKIRNSFSFSERHKKHL